MTSLSKQQELLIAEIKRLSLYGSHLVPLGGEDGKQALVKFANYRALPAHKLIDFVKREEATGIGFRLHSCVVLDIDSDDPKWIKRCEDRFGESAVRVRTPRGGMHLYYFGKLTPCPNLKKEGWPVDVMQGDNEYVVTPYSWRPDGKTYRVEGLELLPSNLTNIRGGKPKPTTRDAEGKVKLGGRHSHLIRKGKEFARNAKSFEQLRSAIEREFKLNCVQGDMSDEEITGIANWCFEIQNSGKNYSRGEQTLPIPGWIVEELKAEPDPQHLLLVLIKAHGADKSRTFILDYECMKNAGLLGLSRDRFRAAKRKLLEVRAIRCFSAHKRGKRKAKYVLCV